MPPDENQRENRLPPNQQLLKGDRWPIVGESIDQVTGLPADTHWSVSVSGLVESPSSFSLDELRQFGLEARQLDIHCVTRWSRYDMQFSGVPLSRIIEHCKSKSGAHYISFVARTGRGHSSSMPLALALKLDAFLALEYEGQPLPAEHGGPVRVIMPGKYFYKSVKWVERIELLADDRLGYWESDAGYHNEADPWKEQRYIAASISKQEAAKLIESLDFRGRDLLGLSAVDRELAGLQAQDAMLRDADFRRANLKDADFAGANLSNAHFQDSQLSGASFAGADLDGADFSGADLRGCNLNVGSMFGTTFQSTDADGQLRTAKINSETSIDESKLGGLTEEQREFLVNATK